MNRFWLASVGIALVASTASTNAEACACSGASGLERVLTASDERWAIGLTENARLVHGFWDQDGNYSRAGSGFQSQLDFSLTGAYRFLPRFELSASIAYGKTMVTAPGFFSKHTGFGDTNLTLRWDLLDEPMPRARSWFHPGIAALGSIRIPSGSIERTTSSAGHVANGSDVSSQSLGAFELALGLEARHSPSERWHLIALGEGAWRAADESLGIERHLGPRLLGQIALSHDLASDLSLALLSNVMWEGDVTLDGKRRSGTGQRLWNVGATVTARLAESGLRTTITLLYAPPLSGVSVNAVGATAFGVALGYSQ